MTYQELCKAIKDRNSFLCVGLDPDLTRLPRFFLDFPDPVFEFNRRVIDATREYCVAYKPNVAFYEALGTGGWEALAKTLDYIPKTHFTIADAKRGDIGNTSRLYARTFFEVFDFDAVTVAPYMGRDSIEPFLNYPGKWVILLALTSNEGNLDFQYSQGADGRYLYERVLDRACQWGSKEQLMFVIGATQPQSLPRIREIAPEHFLLVPGIGSQGGDLQQVFDNGRNDAVGLLVNASRSIIFAGHESHTFQSDVAVAAHEVQHEMRKLLQKVAWT